MITKLQAKHTKKQLTKKIYISLVALGNRIYTKVLNMYKDYKGNQNYAKTFFFQNLHQYLGTLQKKWQKEKRFYDQHWSKNK